MVDNLVLPESDLGGGTVALDDIGGVHYPRSKIVVGVDGTNDGDVAATNPLPIAANTAKDGSGTVYAPLVDSDGHLQIDVLSAPSTAVTNAGTFVVQINGDALTALQLIDDSVYTDGSGTPSKGLAVMGTDGTNPQIISVDTSGHVQVDVLSSALPTGASTASNQSTANSALSAIQTAVEIIDNAISGNEMQVDIVSSATITVDLGSNNDVTIEGGAVLGTDGNAGPANAVSIGGTESDGTFQEIRTDSDGHIQVDVLSGGGGGTQYAVDDALGGTPTGTLSVGIRDDALSSLTPVEGDAVGLRVDANGALWVIPSGTVTVDNAGTFAVQVDGDALTALQLIDDAIYADDADWSDGSSKHILAGGLYQSSPQSITDGDVGPFQVTANGYLITSVNGTVTVDGSGVTQPVSAASLPLPTGAATESTLDSVKTAVEIIDNAVSGSEMQVDIVSDGAGLLTSTVFNAAFGTAGSADSQVMSVQGIASMTPLLVDATGQGDVPITLDGETVTVDLGANNDVTIDNSSVVHSEDATHNSGDAGIMALAVRNDTLAALAGADGDYAPIQVNASGAVFIQEGSALDVSAATVTVDATGQGDIPVTLDSEAVVLGAGSAAIGKLAANSGVDIGDVDVTSISAGSNLIGDVGIQGRTTGGLSIYYDNDLDETAVAVKGSAGTLYAIHAINMTAAPIYLQLFNVAQGSVTVGTTTPTVQFVIPGNADSDGAGFTISIPQGIAFGTAITAAASTDNEGNTGPGNNECHVNLFYK